MLTSDERTALFHCGDHPLTVCPECHERVTLEKIGADPVCGRRDFCPSCRADLTAALRKHLVECTWVRLQAQETRARAQQVRQQARETAKTSQQLRDEADVLAREAEAAQEQARRAKRDRPPEPAP